MINDFHAAILNTVAKNKAPGSDYISEDWRPRIDTPAMKAIREALLLSPLDPVAANWRAIELRRVTEKCDLASMLLKFDGRTGYCLDELQQDMTQYLKPIIEAAFPQKHMRLLGKLRSNAFQIRQWQVSLDNGNYTVVENGKTTNGFVSVSADTTIPLPQSDVLLSLNTEGANSIQIRWGAAPAITLADTALQLRTSLSPLISDLANSVSIFDAREAKLLRDAVVFNGEVGAQIAGATLLLAGTTIAMDPVAEHVLR